MTPLGRCEDASKKLFLILMFKMVSLLYRAVCATSILENPSTFLISMQPEFLETANQILTSITARRSPNSYNISHTNGGKVGRFTLLKHAYKLGEDVIGLFDMPDASVACVQYLVSLQCEEEPSQDILIEGTSPTSCLQGKRTSFDLAMYINCI